MKRFSSALSQVSVALGSSSIRVAVLEESGDRVLMEGKFTHKVNTEGSVWSLEPGKCILVSVGGAAPCPWECQPAGWGDLAVYEPKIWCVSDSITVRW